MAENEMEAMCGLPVEVRSTAGLGVSVAQHELLAWLRDDFERGLSSRGCEAAADEIERLQGVADKYNLWIRFHAAASGDFDDFLKLQPWL